MIQRGEHFGFTLKTREPISVSSQGRRQNLDGHLAFQLGISRPIYLAHASATEQIDQFEDAQSGAGVKANVDVSIRAGADYS